MKSAFYFPFLLWTKQPFDIRLSGDDFTSNRGLHGDLKQLPWNGVFQSLAHGLSCGVRTLSGTEEHMRWMTFDLMMASQYSVMSSFYMLTWSQNSETFAFKNCKYIYTYTFVHICIYINVGVYIFTNIQCIHTVYVCM